MPNPNSKGESIRVKRTPDYYLFRLKVLSLTMGTLLKVKCKFIPDIVAAELPPNSEVMLHPFRVY